MSTTTQDHYLTRHPFPGTGGDRPTPWEVTYTCGGCGVELWSAEEGGLSSPGNALEALDEHLAEVAVEELARQLNLDGWSCTGSARPAGQFGTCADCARTCTQLARFLIEHDYLDGPR